MLTVYSDAPFVERLFARLYGEKHYYLLHIDPSGATAEFEKTLEYFAHKILIFFSNSAEAPDGSICSR